MYSQPQIDDLLIAQDAGRARIEPLETQHGSPYERGQSDYYYGRARRPHRLFGSGLGAIPVSCASQREIDEYHLGYDEAPFTVGEKDWG